MFLEEQRSSEAIELALSAAWVKALTQLAIFLFLISIASMLLHISLVLFVASLVSTVLMAFAFKKFRSSLRGMP
jgi:fatty acid desaturase